MVDAKVVTDRRLAQAEARSALSFNMQRASCFFAENAWQEVEVWALAGQTISAAWKWSDVRSESNPKEEYFQPHVATRDLADEPGGGRKTLGREASSAYRKVRSRCPELLDLEKCIAA